jgi:hypothetical protein
VTSQTFQSAQSFGSSRKKGPDTVIFPDLADEQKGIPAVLQDSLQLASKGRRERGVSANLIVVFTSRLQVERSNER